MDAVVLDVSICMPWCCEDEVSALSEQLLDHAAALRPLHVPSIWPWEITNALLVATRRKRITGVHAAQFLTLLSRFDIRIAPPPAVLDLPRLTSLAQRHNLTTYDASYLDLAIRLALPLATLDDALRKAALAEGLPVL